MVRWNLSPSHQGMNGCDWVDDVIVLKRFVVGRQEKRSTSRGPFTIYSHLITKVTCRYRILIENIINKYIVCIKITYNLIDPQGEISDIGLFKPIWIFHPSIHYQYRFILIRIAGRWSRSQLTSGEGRGHPGQAASPSQGTHRDIQPFTLTFTHMGNLVIN